MATVSAVCLIDAKQYLTEMSSDIQKSGFTLVAHGKPQDVF
jgi:hypothetical protein